MKQKNTAENNSELAPLIDAARTSFLKKTHV